MSIDLLPVREKQLGSSLVSCIGISCLSLTDLLYREPDIRMISEMALRVTCINLLQQLETNSGSPVRGNGKAESQRMEEGFEASEFWIAAF